MTVKETITKEFLDCLHEPSGLESVFQRHSRSKGPLYSALAEATTQLRQRLEKTWEETHEAETQRDQLIDQVEALEERHRELDDIVQVLDQQVHRAEAHLCEVQGLAERTTELAKRGFGEEELARLFDLLGQVAASQSEPPEEGVAQFFETVERYKKVVSLGLETKRAESRAEKAKAEAERWGAEGNYFYGVFAGL